jgi:hypothetical protein
VVVNGNLGNPMAGCIATRCLNVNNRVHEILAKKIATQEYKNSRTDFHLSILQAIVKYGH